MNLAQQVAPSAHLVKVIGEVLQHGEATQLSRICFTLFLRPSAVSRSVYHALRFRLSSQCLSNMRLLDFLPVGLCLAQITAAVALPPTQNGPPKPHGPPKPPGYPALPHPAPPGPPSHGHCKNPPKRVEWLAYSPDQLSAMDIAETSIGDNCQRHRRSRTSML